MHSIIAGAPAPQIPPSALFARPSTGLALLSAAHREPGYQPALRQPALRCERLVSTASARVSSPKRPKKRPLVRR